MGVTLKGMTMKKIFGNIFMLAVACSMTAGCMVEEQPKDEVADVKVSFRAEIQDDVTTRTSLGHVNQILWSSGDEIVVFEKNINASRHTLVGSSAGSSLGEFTPATAPEEGRVMSHNVAFYPYCEASCTEAGKTSYVFTDIYFPAQQTYVEGSFAQKSFPMVAVSEDEELTFRNVGGALKLQLKGNCAVQTITVTGNDNEYIAGKADVFVYTDGTAPEYEDRTAPAVKMQSNALKAVTLNCNGTVLNSDKATDFILILPPVTFEDGFTVNIKDVDGNEKTVTAKVSNTVRRSAILKMPEITIETAAVEGKVITECPFRRGINLSDWLLHEDESEIRTNLYLEEDFQNIRNLGFDAVRLPVDFEAHVGTSPDYVISEYILECIDKAVNWAENAGMYIIIDNHSYLGESFPSEGPAVLKKVFAQVADRYKDRSDKVMYELYNEPSESDLSLKLTWGTLQPALIDIIRSVDKKHTIIVSGFGSSIDNLENVSGLASKDKNLIYTFHFYAPALFTHQGADWNDSPMQYLESPVPFPYNENEMPAKPDQFIGSYNEEDYDSYEETGNVLYLEERLQKAVDFANTYNVPVYCGEWGVLNKMASQEDYCYYHKVVREMLEENNIGWTLWAYRDDFSVFNRNSACIFEKDLNAALLAALDLTVPSYYDTWNKPAEVVFYDDEPASFLKLSSYNYTSDVNFESRYLPYAGDRCIDWTLGGNYADLTFELWPVADFTAQASMDYDLVFMIKSEDDFSSPLTVRFTEYYEEDGNAYVWRYAYLMTNKEFASDGEWHEVRLPMSSFTNMGGSLNGGWVDQDKTRPCDWTKINKVQFAVEGKSALKGNRVYLDEVRLESYGGDDFINGFDRNNKWDW